MKDGNMFRITSSYAAAVMFVVLTAAQIGNNVGKYKFLCTVFYSGLVRQQEAEEQPS